MFAAFAVMIVITIAAPMVLGMLGFSSAERQSGAAVRLSGPAD
ncbi:MAG: hypothetical protein Kow0058_10000 [Roseovarius sp.]